MRYVIVRDDDTNALMPIEYLERLYRPFLDRNLPVNLATIPNVNTEASFAKGQPEWFLMAKSGPTPKTLPIASNRPLVDYLKDNPGYKIVQHGCRHESVSEHREFAHDNRRDISRRLEEGTQHLIEAGFGRPKTFVAPYDLLSATSFDEVSRRFEVISTGWYQLSRLPRSWWPRYVLKKLKRENHWRIGRTVLLSHPGCYLSYHRPPASILNEIIRTVKSQQLTVLVTHWWEYFRDNKPDGPFIDVLHETAEYLAAQKDVRVIAFDDLASGRIALN